MLPPNLSQLPRTQELNAEDDIHIIQDGEDKVIAAGDFQKYAGVGGPHTHPISEIVGLQDVLDEKIELSDLPGLIEENSVDATESVKGISRFGTEAEVKDGVLDNVSVSPLNLKLTLDERF